MRCILFVSIVLIFHRGAFSQCCSPGNPIGGTTNLGILAKNTFRVIGFYRYSYAQGYWEGTKKSDYNFVKNGNYNYTGLILGYGLFRKLTFETELGYFINKTQTYDLEPEFKNTGFGFDNAVLSLKYNLFARTETPFEWTLGFGAKVPFTKKYQIADGVELPRDVQPSTHAFGTVTQSFLYKGFPKEKIKIFLINRFETNTTDNKNYKFGNFLMSSFFLAKQIGETGFAAIFQARHEYRTKDISNVTDVGCAGCFAKGTYVNSSGGQFVFISPQINYSTKQKWNISLLVDLPVYRNYNGTQLGNVWAFALFLSKDFALKCDVPEVEIPTQ